MMHPPVGIASWFAFLPAESRSTNPHYNNSSKLHSLQMNYASPPHFPLPYHLQVRGERLAVVMVVRGDVEHGRLSPN